MNGSMSGGKTPQEVRVERLCCAADASYFINTWVRIESPEQRALVPFSLWPAQEDALAALQREPKLVVLKARQLGLTWLALSHALWLMLFRPAATVLLFSLRESEARELLRRLRALHAALPPWLQARTTRVQAGAHTGDRWALANGSRALAFSTRAGRSYTGTLAIVDEADFVPHLGTFLNAVKPTVDGGGQLLLISTADKAQPQSTFKRLFRAAWAGTGEYAALFLPWSARPDRSAAWYARLRAEMFAQRGSDDDLLQEYPATAEEALRVRVSAARVPPQLVAAATAEATPLPNTGHGATFFVAPEPGRAYVIGADPAEGNPASDESAAVALDALTGEQVALLAGQMAPETFAARLVDLSAACNGAPVLVERNNHGHTVLAWLRDTAVALLRGADGRPGWLTTAASKTRLFDELARAVAEGRMLLHDGETSAQLASIEALTLRAPQGQHDDRAIALGLALAALLWGGTATVAAPIAADDPLVCYDRTGF